MEQREKNQNSNKPLNSEEKTIENEAEIEEGQTPLEETENQNTDLNAEKKEALEENESSTNTMQCEEMVKEETNGTIAEEMNVHKEE